MSPPERTQPGAGEGDTVGSVKDTYTHGHHSSVLKSHTWRTAENSAGYLLPHLDASMRLLDVGCGPATITCDLADRVASVVGIEPVPGILERAEATRVERGVENVQFEVGSAYELQFENDTFDIVHAHQVLQHLSDPVAVLREMIRVTRPAGLIAIRDADYLGMTWQPGSPELDRWLEIYRAVARDNDAEPDAGRHLLRWALDAGVARSNITTSLDTWLFSNAEDCGWWGDLWADRTVNSTFGEQALDYRHTTEDELQAIADAWRAWASDPAAWFTVPNGELLIRV